MMAEEWEQYALCTQADPDLWFPAGGHRSAQISLAKEWCAQCPVIAECERKVSQLEAGEPAEKRYGVWAGMTPHERWKADQAA